MNSVTLMGSHKQTPSWQNEPQVTATRHQSELLQKFLIKLFYSSTDFPHSDFNTTRQDCKQNN